MIDQRLGSARNAIAIIGLTFALASQAQDNDAEIPDIDTGREVGRYQMFSPEGDGIMSTIPFDTATGRVWRFFTNCGDDLEDANGCFTEVPSYPKTDDGAALVLDAIRRAFEEASEPAQERDPEGVSDPN
ncbi:MAG: hypothetical protein OXI11_06590 [Gammaproteobacteria bacterium]|nr:hypothetical protein [Gammaproteobacteria bacterium]MXW45434.1 hypothetical protein [Gammaproteobacteria bacterium]MYD01288.1 hypothetical protein [Gammaproteobacteria bacterium]MYI25104.1 hypothetical protein [Gammaproteobacteria bacterium]